ncbi:MAG: TonB-dependent receptor, partial [Verrucomicrobia bacterium]|nr:TonB-dependent receptor [Verrucomicrobiota bacterium]
YQQQLKLNRLPKWAQGFGVYGNYTYMRTEGDYGNTASATFASKELAGFLPRTANLGVSYIGHPWDIRLQWVFRGHRLTTNSTNAAALRYDSNRLTHNVKIRYLFSEKYILFIDVENITAVPYVKTVYRTLNSNLPSDTGTVSPRWVGGLQGRF